MIQFEKRTWLDKLLRDGAVVDVVEVIISPLQLGYGRPFSQRHWPVLSQTEHDDGQGFVDNTLATSTHF